MGLSIFLIDQDHAINDVCQQFATKYGIQTRAATLDLLAKDAVEHVLEVASTLDVSVLVNNVGIGEMVLFSQQDIVAAEQLINLNAVVATKLTHALLPQLTARNKRSAIIFMSSLAAVFGFPYGAVYAGTKAYLKYFSLSLSEEIKATTDVCLLNLGS